MQLFAIMYTETSTVYNNCGQYFMQQYKYKNDVMMEQRKIRVILNGTLANSTGKTKKTNSTGIAKSSWTLGIANNKNEIRSASIHAPDQGTQQNLVRKLYI